MKSISTSGLGRQAFRFAPLVALAIAAALSALQSLFAASDHGMTPPQPPTASGTAHPVHGTVPDCIGATCAGQPADGGESPDEAVPDSDAKRVLTQWKRFALNALLEPLLTTEEPLRWETSTLEMPCDMSMSVWVDGKPLRAGDPVPPDRFVMRWQLDECMPLGPASLSLSGNVYMHVRREPTRIDGVISSDDLVIDSTAGRFAAREPFSATLLLGPTGHRE